MKNVADIYPLTPTQNGILYHALHDSDPELYFEQVRCDLVGPLDVDRLRQAWQRLFDHHPGLRTAFVWSGVKQPVQVVRETVELTFTEIDLGNAEEPPTAAALDQLAAGQRTVGFDLQRAPVSRFTVVHSGPDRAHFIWDFHHILLDGWSATNVFDQAIRLYNEPDATLDSAVPFRRYVEWHQTQDERKAEAYWTDLLADHPGAPEFQLALPTPSADDLEPRREHRLDDELSNRLRTFAREHRITVNALMQGAWAIVVGRYSDRRDVTFGIVTSGRPAEVEDVEDIVGMFLSALPLRVDVDSDLAIDQWLGDLQGQQLDSISHQYAALADIRRWAGLAAGEELFDSILVFENFPAASPEPNASIVVADKQVFEQTHYGLTVMIRPEDTFAIATLFDPAKFAADDVDRIIDLFIATLDRLVESASATGSVAPADVAPLLAADAAFLDAQSRTEATFDDEAVMHDLILRTCAEHPASPALVDADSRHTVTYAGLAEQSGRLAAELSKRGVEPGDTVGVSLPRSVEQVVALLAVWRAGAAYVPIDPEHPEDRRRLLAERASVRLTVDADSLTDLMAGGEAPDEMRDRGGSVDATSAACVIFTSGSTGEPKPVELHHRGIVNRCQWQLGLHPMSDDEVCLAKTTLNFVDHLWELWGPLIAGRPVVLLAEDAVRDPKRFAAAIADHRIRRLTLVPSLLDVTLDYLAGSDSPLELVTVSGEPLSAGLASRFAASLPQARLFNFYGMSEGTADATWFEVPANTEAPGAPTPGSAVPIGRPLANMSVEVLDRHRRRVPLGVAGELYVGGVGVATGYRDQPDLTEAAFVEVELGVDLDGGQTRVYRTGDIGRWTPDGQLDFAGRADRQVKIRGVRVEPAEIEVALQAHPAVSEAVVSAVGESDTHIRLVSHVVATEVATDELLAWVTQRVPAALVPSRIELITELPKLPTGKVDRGGLAKLAAAAVSSTIGAASTPANEAEAEMVQLWQEVLGTDAPIGPDDDFFEIGGDSLLAVRLFSQVDRHYGQDLPLAEVFAAPTPRAMVARLQASSSPTDAETSADRPVVWLVSDTPEPFGELQRRMGRTVDLRVVSEAEVGTTASGTANLHFAGYGTGAAAALRVARRRLAERSTVESIILINATVTAADVEPWPDGQTPGAIYFFEPSETESRVPLLDSPELKARLDDRTRWSGAADTVDTVLAPGTPADLLSEPNVGWLANLIADRIDSAATWHHLVPISDTDTPHRRLFAVHGEFGNVVGYRDLAVALGPAWSVVGVQASGVYGTRPLHTSIEEMAEAYLDEVCRMQPEGPYLIAGYSSGGTVAYEMARRLTAAGHQVEPVLWFDHYRVEAFRAEPKSKQLARVAGNRLKAALTDREAFQAGLKRRELQRKVDQVMSGDPSGREWWWAITELADDRAEAENLRRMLIGDNMREVRSRYRHDSYDGPIVLYQAHTVDSGREPDRGWSDDEFNLERVAVPGDHTSLLLEPNVSAIAADLHHRFGVG